MMIKDDLQWLFACLNGVLVSQTSVTDVRQPVYYHYCFQKAVEEMGYSSSEELVSAINKLSASIQRVKDKINGIQTGQETTSQVS